MSENSGCPPPGTWDDIATGLLIGDEAEQLLEHASNCAECAHALRQSLAVFAAEPEKRPGMLSMRGFAAAAAVAFALASLGLWYWKSRSAGVQEQLVQAYLSRRDMDLRWPGAPYAVLRAERGAATLSYEFHTSREAIEKGVASSPNDGTWRLRLGESLILEGDAERAVTELKRALALGADPLAGKSALAMAYYLRAERGDRKADAEAADVLLTEVSLAKPDDRTLLFNRALVKERLGDIRGALALWDTLIGVEADEAWRKEASERRDKLRRSLN